MKKYENSESILTKIFNALPIGAMIGVIILGIVFACAIKDDGSKEERKGSYHDYNHAIIIAGKEGTTVELDSYSRTITDKYVLYTKDGKVYECPVDNVVFYNE
jgi:hypothetical protein